jgi:KDO2-lipid IV(A) lauroyltransferase
MEFLNQDTPVFLGTEGLSKKLEYPIVYISISRPKRGYYKMKAEVLISDPANTSYGEITEKHTRRLEADIKDSPDIWLWTHRRWKHKRPSDV